LTNKNHEFLTNNTSLAAYLISEGYDLLIIRYEETPRGKIIGTFAFGEDPQMQSVIKNFNLMNAPGDIVRYEHARRNLVERVLRGLS